MSSDWHCPIHDRDYAPHSQCPVCRAEELADLAREANERQQETMEAQREAEREAQKEAERRHEERLEAIRDAEYRRANPGDYSCPHCFYTTLRFLASRCPMCHGTVGGDYWNPILEAKRKAEAEEAERRRKAAEEWERTRPEREAREAKERAEREAKEARERAEREAREAWDTWKGLMAGYMVWLLPAPVYWSMIAMAQEKLAPMMVVIPLVPLFNWLLLLVTKLYSMPPYNGFSYLGPMSAPAIAHFIPHLLLGWAVAGAIGIRAIISMRKKK